MRPVFCDIDGVLADFTFAFTKMLNAEFGTPINHQYDQPTWRFDTEDGRFNAEQVKWGWKQVRKATNWWETMETLVKPKTFERLAREHRSVPIIFVTARTSSAGDTVQQQTIRWLEAHGIRSPLVITRSSVNLTGKANKVGLIETFQPRCAIDDAPQTALDFAAAGVQVYVPLWPYTAVVQGEPLITRCSLEKALDRAEVP